MRCESGYISFHGTVDFQWVGVGPEAEPPNSHWRPERYYWKVGQICPVDFQWVGVGPEAEAPNSHWRPERYYWKVGQICPCP